VKILQKNRIRLLKSLSKHQNKTGLIISETQSTYHRLLALQYGPADQQSALESNNELNHVLQFEFKLNLIRCIISRFYNSQDFYSTESDGAAWTYHVQCCCQSCVLHL